MTWTESTDFAKLTLIGISLVGVVGVVLILVLTGYSIRYKDNERQLDVKPSEGEDGEVPTVQKKSRAEWRRSKKNIRTQFKNK